MTEFQRVRDINGVEYDAPVQAIERWPEEFTVLDPEIVYYQRPAFQAEVPAPPKSGAGSGESEWRAYAERLGIDATEAESRGDIIALLEERVSNSGITDGAEDPEPIQAREIPNGPVAEPVEEITHDD